jgi:hypothetical protein
MRRRPRPRPLWAEPGDPIAVFGDRPDWTAADVVGAALAGVPGFDDATRADLAGLPPAPGGWVLMRPKSDPLEPARAVLAQIAPGATLTRDAGGSIRVVPAPGGPGR